MAQKFDHVKTDILPDGSQSEPDYRHLMSSKEPEVYVSVYLFVGFTIGACLVGFVGGYLAGYGASKQERAAEVIAREDQ